MNVKNYKKKLRNYNVSLTGEASKIMNDIEKMLKPKNGKYFLDKLQEICKKNKLNYYKVLCLKWQRETNKKCGNKNHRKEIYKNELECEAQLIESINLFIIYGQVSKKNIDKMIKILTK